MVQINMKMPENCLKCPLMNGPKAWVCAITGKSVRRKSRLRQRDAP